MKLSCNVIQDILPLAVENLASAETMVLVNEHIKDCAECRKEYKELKISTVDFMDKKELEAIPLRNVKKKLKNRNIYTGVLTALIISLLLFIGFDKATKPIPLSYVEAIESVENKDGKVFIKFKKEVSNYDIEESRYDEIDYNIMAWKTNIGTLFKESKAKTTVIDIEEDKLVSIHYINQGGGLDIPIYGKYYDGGRATLRRLAMNYYLYIMIVIFMLFMILSLIFRKKDQIKKITMGIMFFSLSYILAHMVVFGGVQGITHHMNRDLSFIAIIAILIFSIIITIRSKYNFTNFKNTK